MPVFPGKVEECRQHHRGQLDRDLIDPIEGFVSRQPVEHGCRAVADRRLHVTQVGRGDDRCDGLALRGMARRIHPNEIRQLLAERLVLNLNAAEVGGRGIGHMIQFDGHDVVVSGHRPIGAIGAFGAVMHRVFPSETFKGRVPGIVQIERRIADIDLVERYRLRASFAVRLPVQ